MVSAKYSEKSKVDKLKISVVDQLTDIMSTLNQQWYNAIVAGCNLDDQQFQIYQGYACLPSTDQGIWHIFDSVPPKSCNSFYQSTQTNFFSQDYGNILNSLNSPKITSFQNAIGEDLYITWLTDLKSALIQQPALNQLTYFRTWCQSHCPDKCVPGGTALSQTMNDALYNNLTNYLAANGVYAYTIKSTDIDMKKGAFVSFEFDSETSSSNTSSSWAQGEVDYNILFFSSKSSSSYVQMSQKLSSSKISITMTINHLLTVNAGPLYEKEATGDLPWYNSSIINRAYNDPSNTTWIDGGAANWGSTFGDNGNMKRIVSDLVLASGIDLTIKITVSLSDSEYSAFKEAADEGFWPFYQKANNSGWSQNQYSYDGNTLTVHMASSDDSVAQILGILQTPAPSYFSSLMKQKLQNEESEPNLTAKTQIPISRRSGYIIFSNKQWFGGVTGIQIVDTPGIWTIWIANENEMIIYRQNVSSDSGFIAIDRAIVNGDLIIGAINLDAIDPNDTELDFQLGID